MPYRTLEDTFWNDPDLKHLSFELHSFLAYLITNRHTHYSGIYYLPKAFIIKETRLTAKKVNEYLAALAINNSGKFYALYDEERDIVWVKNMLTYQAKSTNKKTTLQGTAKQLAGLHKSPLIKLFLDHYKPEIEKWLSLRAFNSTERENVALSLSVLVPALPGIHETKLTAEQMDGKIVVIPASDAPVKAPETPATPPEEPTPTQGEEKKPKSVKKAYGEFKNVKLTTDEYKKLVDRFGENAIKRKIEELSIFIGSKKGGDKYKDHYVTLIGWMTREIKDKEGNIPERPEQKVCTKDNPKPEGDTSSWKHPDLDKKKIDGKVVAARCNNCKQVFM